MFPHLLCLALLGGLSAASVHTHAEPRIYGGAHAAMLSFEVDNVTFRPWLAGVHGGFQMENGLGAEVALASGVAEDDKNNTELTLNYAAQTYLTYSLSNEIPGARRGQLTFGGGYSLFDTNTQTDNTDYPGDQSWEGPAILARYSEYLKSHPKINLAASYEHFYLDDHLSVFQVKLGVSYDF